MATVPNRYQEIDWEGLYKRLYARAAKLTHGSNVVIDCGVSAEDLVTETLGEFFASPNGLGWKAVKGKIEAFLGRVLFNKFIDHVRRNQKLDAEVDPVDSKSPDPTLEERVQFESLQRKLLERIKGREDEKQLEELILAASMTTSEGKVNQQLADLLGTDANDVVNRRNKLLRIAGVRALYEQWRQGQKTNGGSS